MRIRRANVSDIPVVLSLWEKADLSIKSKGRDHPENLAKQMASENMWILLAEEDEEIIGVVLVTHDTRKGWINRLAVHPSKLRRGIGSKLLKAAEGSLHAQGITVYCALIGKENIPSRRLFEQAGYSFSERITYYRRKESPDS